MGSRLLDTTCDDAIKRPLVVAPMAGGPSTPALATAAAHAGGLGFLAGGYLTSDGLDERMQTMAEQGGARYGVNLFAPQEVPTDPVSTKAVLDYAELLKPAYRRFGLEMPTPQWDGTDRWDDKVATILRAVDAGYGPAVVSVTFGTPPADVVAFLQESGVEVWATVATVEAAKAAVANHVNALVVQGPAAGGHRATLRMDETPSTTPLPELLHDVASAIDTAETPLVAAGGLSDPGSVSHALEQTGVVAVSAGTAFLLADEAGTNSAYRAAVRKHREGTTSVTRAFSGRPARGIVNAFMSAYDSFAPASYPAVNSLTKPIRKAAIGANDAGYLSLWAGEGLAFVRSRSTAETFDYLLSIYED